MADEKKLEVTEGGKAVSGEEAARVKDALKKTLSDQIQKKTPGVRAAGDVSSHARW